MPPTATVVHIALGSNLGDRRRHVDDALAALARIPGIRVLRHSPFHESAPVGDGPPQGPYWNGVAELATELDPRALLGVLQALERAAGRELPAPRNQPRPLDLDILFYGDLQIDSANLVVPHPRWHEREFVLRPLRELGVDVSKRHRWQRPVLVQDPAAIAQLCTNWQRNGCSIGLVPTMGSLHEGHSSLVRRARAENDRVVATIFVNPLQFGPNEDLAAYPRDLTGDLQRCTAAGADAVFAPSVAQMYDPEFASHIAIGAAAEGMEGALRPGHFSGVATVVARLFALCQATRAYFGEKDAQQLAVIRRMRQDLGFPVQVVPCPIVRERDGLAMSSRNVYLGAADRQAATVLVRALQAACRAFAGGERDRDRLLQQLRRDIAGEPRAQLDYVELRREPDLRALPPGPVAGGRLLVAAKFVDGARPVRLLDNMSLEAPWTGP